MSRADCTRLWRRDEYYYLLDREATAFNAQSGEAFVFRAGDAMLIPPSIAPRERRAGLSKTWDYRSALVTRYST